LALTSLNLSSNSLGELNDWCWLRGTKLRQTLGELDLSSNGLTYFPPPLVKFESLVSLNLNHNQLSRLPFGIRRLQALRKLHVCSNKLESLPAAIEDLHVDLLDVWGNCFKSFNAEADQQFLGKRRPQTHHIPCGSRPPEPWTTVSFLCRRAPCPLYSSN